MNQLTIGEILDFIKTLTKEREMSLEDVRALPVYIGDDDELNGIHCGWDCRIVDVDDEEDEYYVEMINERGGNFNITDSAILIS